MNKIITCNIGPYPKDMFDMNMPKVTVTFEDGSKKELFWFYPDELRFSEHEFVGKTEAEALALRTKKDIAYLRS
jgi:hypothetical protein